LGQSIKVAYDLTESAFTFAGSTIKFIPLDGATVIVYGMDKYASDHKYCFETSDPITLTFVKFIKPLE
jgi:hypothetical protein